MTPEERQLLTGLFDRVRAASTSPRDAEAEALIAEEVRNQPYAPYLLAQTVIIQERALHVAGEQMQRLQAHVQQLEAQASQQTGATTGGSFLGGVSGSPLAANEPPQPASAPHSSVPLSPAWGNVASNQPPNQPPAYAASPVPLQNPGPWGQPQQHAGGSFLHGALGAAAGVAGGVLLADSLRGLFGFNANSFGIGGGLGGFGGGLGGFGGGLGGFGGGLGSGFGQGNGETVVNNYYESGQGDQPAQDPADVQNDNPASTDTYQADYSDNGSFDPGNGTDDSFNV